MEDHDKIQLLVQHLTISAELLDEQLRLSNPENVPGVNATLREVVDWHIERVLAVHNGNKSETARMLGIGRKTLHRRENGGH